MSNEAHECILLESLDQFDQAWHCLPPAEGVRYRVLRDGWNYDSSKPVRHVYEWAAA